MRPRGKLWNDYGEWLIERVGCHKRRYSTLFNHLHEIPFIFSIPLDKNRASDGMRLREEYALDIGCPEVIFDKDCSVLEMLVGLAIRMEEEYIGNPVDEHPERIFWEMIENLFDFERNGVRSFMNEAYNSGRVEFIVDRWLRRGFSYDGSGSIFPLKHATRDQRDIEIWSQMNEYLSENYI